MKTVKILLAFTLIINLNLSAQKIKIDNIFYNIYESRQCAYVTYESTAGGNKYNNSKGDIVIPNYITYKNVTYPVKGIETGAYLRSKITSITIPSNVTDIGVESFGFCDSLTRIVFEDSKTPITLVSPNYYGSFNASYNIKEIYIGRTLRTDYKDKIALRLSLYDSIQSVVFGNMVDTIPPLLCDNCKPKEKIKIPNSVKFVGRDAFMSSNLCDTLDLRNVCYIEDMAFYDNQNVKHVALGDSLTGIGESAFGWCDNIESIYMLKSKAITCSTTIFSETVYNNAILYVPKGRIQAFSRTTPWNKFYIEELKSFNVTFVIDNKVYEKISVDYGKEIILPEPPVKEGHTFNGWESVPTTMPAKDITITGSFSTNNYAITYMVDGVIFVTDSIEYNTKIPQIEIPAKEGHTFNGWKNIPTTMPAEDITITGSFTKNKYKITYTVDGNIFASDSIEYGSQISQTTTPTKEGHTFCGWSEIPDTMPAEDITITGSFEVNSYKAFFLVGNSVYAILSFNYGETITPPINPQKDGYIFNNWTNLPENMPAEDIVMIANFTENTENTGVYDIYENSIDNLYYDLKGNRIKKTARGIYIINGKKIFIK